MILPALAQAPSDRRVSDSALRVLVWLHGQLDLVAFRPVKAWVLAATLEVKPHTASAALRELVQAGYLDAGPRQARRVGTYRLVGTLPATH